MKISSPESTSRAVYESWHERVAADDKEADRPWHELLFKHLEVGDIAGRRVLEIGCGRGELACRLAMMTAGPRRLIAADFAESAVHLGQKRAAARSVSHVSWLVASMQEIPMADASFDTIISCETIEHVPEPRQAVEELKRVLTPGGRLFLTTPNYLGPFGAYRGYLRARGRRYDEGGQPICHLTTLPRTVSWMHRAGLRIQTVDAVGHYLLWPGRAPLEVPRLDRIRPLRWFALHSLVVAERP
jgi:cyclopropane fatty-acyl-phospholipid synthase-like methyltransferase